MIWKVCLEMFVMQFCVVEISLSFECYTETLLGNVQWKFFKEI